ncbi:MAG: hypothetical protein KDC57_09020 [Saprospiraceae bacterium]|nr:hypothetical protein [Saprospiraceae bacterium]
MSDLRRGLISLIIVILAFHRTFAQGTYVDEIMTSYQLTGIWQVDQKRLYDPSQLVNHINRLIQYSLDTAFSLREKSYQVMDDISRQPSGTTVGALVLDRLVKGLSDPAAVVRTTCVQRLMHFPDTLFSFEQQQAVLEMAISEESPDAIKLTGYLNPPHAIPVILPIIHQTGSSRAARMAARMAVARMGDPEQILFFQSVIRKAELNDDNLLAIGEVVSYIRRKELVDELIRIVVSNQRSCTSTDPDHSRPILCAYRAMEYLAQVVMNFPFGLRASGDLDTEDYPLALNMVRSWINANPDYQLIKNIY